MQPSTEEMLVLDEIEGNESEKPEIGQYWESVIAVLPFMLLLWRRSRI